ncbi:hypothetical protein K461DRAFT_6996 [Myriangium duriaei CBS 260.36]|uniref:Uncharacterized protein n=1 Tax=Myriangium duriaei CBS 260.36 TaxID=1168546 RepID=A0A9P4MRU4_9PEZI|nr:hypothetical protein K461DRAFT_6996 [Myriangium duriaei CBS 260.36]
MAMAVVTRGRGRCNPAGPTPARHVCMRSADVQSQKVRIYSSSTGSRVWSPVAWAAVERTTAEQRGKSTNCMACRTVCPVTAEGILVQVLDRLLPWLSALCHAASPILIDCNSQHLVSVLREAFDHLTIFFFHLSGAGSLPLLRNSLSMATNCRVDTGLFNWHVFGSGMRRMFKKSRC